MKASLRSICVLLSLILLVPFVFSCGKSENGTVMKLGGFEVGYDLFRFAVISERDALIKKYGDEAESGGNSAKIAEEVRSGAVGYLRTLYAILSLAADNNIHESDPAITDTVNRMIASDEASAGGRSELLASIKESGMTEEVYEFLVRVSVMSDELYYAMLNSGQINTDKDFVRGFIEGDGCVRVKQVLVTTDGRTEEEALELAEKVRELAVSGVDFDKLISEYGEDMKMFGSSAGYYLMRGVMYLPFEEASFALEIDGISEVVKTPAGYSVIKRFEKDPEYISNHFDSLAEDYYDSVFSLAREERAAELEMTDADLFEKTDVMTVQKRQ